MGESNQLLCLLDDAFVTAPKQPRILNSSPPSRLERFVLG